MAGFAPHPDFDAGSLPAADWPLCHVRLQDDARFPWLILIPRQAGLGEVEDLSPADRARLMEETMRAAALVRAIGERLGRPVGKLNIAALGNVTPQLHVHVIGRRRDDEAWPRPVWGVGEVRPWDVAERDSLLALIAAG